MENQRENNYIEAITVFGLLTALAFTCSAIVMVVVGFI